MCSTMAYQALAAAAGLKAPASTAQTLSRPNPFAPAASASQSPQQALAMAASSQMSLPSLFAGAGLPFGMAGANMSALAAASGLGMGLGAPGFNPAASLAGLQGLAQGLAGGLGGGGLGGLGALGALAGLAAGSPAATAAALQGTTQHNTAALASLLGNVQALQALQAQMISAFTMPGTQSMLAGNSPMIGIMAPVVSTANGGYMLVGQPMLGLASPTAAAAAAGMVAGSRAPSAFGAAATIGLGKSVAVSSSAPVPAPPRATVVTKATAIRAGGKTGNAQVTAVRHCTKGSNKVSVIRPAAAAAPSAQPVAPAGPRSSPGSNHVSAFAPPRVRSISNASVSVSAVQVPRKPTRPIAKARRVVASAADLGKFCASCNCTNTPVWREVEGVTLCNACGIRWRRTGLACYDCKYIPRAHQAKQRFCPRCGKNPCEFAPYMSPAGAALYKALGHRPPGPRGLEAKEAALRKAREQLAARTIVRTTRNSSKPEDSARSPVKRASTDVCDASEESERKVSRTEDSGVAGTGSGVGELDIDIDEEEESMLMMLAAEVEARLSGEDSPASDDMEESEEVEDEEDSDDDEAVEIEADESAEAKMPSTPLASFLAPAPDATLVFGPELPAAAPCEAGPGTGATVAASDAVPDIADSATSPASSGAPSLAPAPATATAAAAAAAVGPGPTSAPASGLSANGSPPTVVVQPNTNFYFGEGKPGPGSSPPELPPRVGGPPLVPPRTAARNIALGSSPSPSLLSSTPTNAPAAAPAPPAVPPPPPNLASLAAAKSAAGLTSLPQPKRPIRQDSLSSMVENGGLLLHERSRDTGLFYRDVIKEGWLSKLPPAKNTFQSWRRRWFKLVIQLQQETLAHGPVLLEYYNSPRAAKAKGIIDLDAVTRIAGLLSVNHDRRLRKLNPGRLLEIHAAARTYTVMADGPSLVGDWVQTLSDVMGMGSDHQPPAASRFTTPKPGELRRFEGIVLNSEVNNALGALVISDRGVALVCPDADKELALWPLTHIKGFGYIKQVFWFEVATGPDLPPGMLCFSTTHAEEMYVLVNHHVAAVSAAPRRQRFSRRHNMSWSSSIDALSTADIDLDDDEPVAPPRPSREATAALGPPREVFGHTIPALDLVPVAIGVALTSHTAVGPNEFSYREGEGMRILATRAFLDRGYFLAERTDQAGLGLVHETAFQLQEHDFSRADTASRDSLDDVDQAMFAPADTGASGTSTLSGDAFAQLRNALADTPTATLGGAGAGAGAGAGTWMGFTVTGGTGGCTTSVAGAETGAGASTGVGVTTGAGARTGEGVMTGAGGLTVAPGALRVRPAMAGHTDDPSAVDELVAAEVDSEGQALGDMLERAGLVGAGGGAVGISVGTGSEN
eukprot:m.115658 g.115658  ORF g.115658 m.115658 type:complete len:1369 (-) comp14452_c15_seq6:1104-5210(-)